MCDLHRLRVLLFASPNQVVVHSCLLGSERRVKGRDDIVIIETEEIEGGQ